MTTNLNETFAAVQVASRELALLNDNVINQILNAVADAAIAKAPFILAENEKDLARMDPNDPKYDRLKLTEERLKGIAADTRNVATLPSPLGKILKETVRPNGMKLTKISVPFGSVTIYDVGKSFDVHCMSDGFTKNRVLPLPEPPITRIFLFLAYFGCFGRLFMVSRSVCVKGILFSNTGSVYGFMSSAPPQRAEPYSVPRRYFFAFLPLV